MTAISLASFSSISDSLDPSRMLLSSYSAWGGNFLRLHRIVILRRDPQEQTSSLLPVVVVPPSPMVDVASKSSIVTLIKKNKSSPSRVSRPSKRSMKDKYLISLTLNIPGCTVKWPHTLMSLTPKK